MTAATDTTTIISLRAHLMPRLGGGTGGGAGASTGSDAPIDAASEESDQREGGGGGGEGAEGDSTDSIERRVLSSPMVPGHTASLPTAL